MITIVWKRMLNSVKKCQTVTIIRSCDLDLEAWHGQWFSIAVSTIIKLLN